ncbi:MAG TPA: hypothetical protein VGY56_20465 [Verrucomicrobiae bacterium]|nr:hypothetical protein [Verrucomicrobiae bacterium]
MNGRGKVARDVGQAESESESYSAVRIPRLAPAFLRGARGCPFSPLTAAGIFIFSASLLRAQLIDVDFNNDSYGAAHGGPAVGPTMSGAAVLGAAGDQWNGIDVNNGTGIPLIYANGSNSPVTMTFTSQGGYDANSFGGSTPFAGTPYDALMEDYLFTKGVLQTITLSGLVPNSYYDLVLYNAGDNAATGGRATFFTVNAYEQASIWNATSNLMANWDYVAFPTAQSDGSGNLVITWTGNGTAEGDVDGFQIESSPAIPPLPVRHVAAGQYHTLFTLSDGSLWGMGDNGDGELGLGQSVLPSPFPQQIVASDVVAMAAGYDTTLYIKSDGSLWALGYNNWGEVGGGTYVDQVNPVKIASSQATVVASGGDFSLYGTFHFPAGPGSLLGMGDNSVGELGKTGFSETNTPQLIVSVPSGEGAAATALAAGFLHSLFIQPGGRLWGMGNNQDGELGDGTTSNKFAPEELVASNVVAIAGGSAHSLFVKSDGSLWGMGGNSQGELGDGTYNNNQYFPEQILTSNVTAVAAGEFHSLFIKSDGSLWGMGDNTYGQLGETLAIPGTNLPVEIVPGNVVAISAGLETSLFIKSDGSLWGMGANKNSALGDGRYTNNVYVPIEIVPLAPVANGGFETGDFTAWTTNGNVAYTYVTASSPYTKSLYIHSGAFGAQLGPVGSPGYLSQTLLTKSGTSYALSLWLNSPGGAAPNEFQVSWNGATIFDQTNFATPGWTNIVLPVTATGANTVLQFGSRNDNSYFGLDDITLVTLQQPIITGISPAGTNLVLHAGNGQTGATYFTLTSTNLLLPLSQWTPIGTNVLSVSGSFTITITPPGAITPGIAQQRFSILKMLE